MELRAIQKHDSPNANSYVKRMWSLGSSDGNGTTNFTLSMKDVELLKDTFHEAIMYVTYETTIYHEEAKDTWMQTREIHTKMCQSQGFSTIEWNCEYPKISVINKLQVYYSF